MKRKGPKNKDENLHVWEGIQICLKKSYEFKAESFPSPIKLVLAHKIHYFFVKSEICRRGCELYEIRDITVIHRIRGGCNETQVEWFKTLENSHIITDFKK